MFKKQNQLTAQTFTPSRLYTEEFYDLQKLSDNEKLCSNKYPFTDRKKLCLQINSYIERFYAALRIMRQTDVILEKSLRYRGYVIDILPAVGTDMHRFAESFLGTSIPDGAAGYVECNNTSLSAVFCELLTLGPASRAAGYEAAAIGAMFTELFGDEPLEIFFSTELLINTKIFYITEAFCCVRCSSLTLCITAGNNE